MSAVALLGTFTRNESGRDLVVGDIHGNFTRLQKALDEVGFDPSCDRLFSVGDLVDRGPANELVTDWIAKPWFHAVRGNHDDFAIRHVKHGKIDPQNYIRNGGAWFLGLSTSEQEEIATQLEQLPFAIEVETAAGLVGIVHADCPYDSWQQLTHALTSEMTRNQSKQLTDWLMWARDRFESRFEGGVAGVVALIVGHNPVREAGSLGNVVYIDTMGWRPEGHFTFFDLSTMQILPALLEAA